MSKPPHKILIINPGGVGDLIMFSPALQILKNNFPDSISIIDIFVSYTTGRTGIFQDSLFVNKIFFFDFQKNNFLSKIKLIHKFRKEKYDLVFVASGVNPLMGSLFAFLTGAKTRAGEYRKAKLTFYTNQVKLDVDKHKIETNLNLLKALDIKIESPAPLPFFEMGADDKKFAEEFIQKNSLENKILIGFSIGSGTAQQFKLWPKENFIKLGKKILDGCPDAIILLFGSLGEKDLCLKMQNELEEKAISVIGKTLCQVAALTDQCRIFVSSDTGLSHIAATTSANLIAIFGPTISERTGPVGPRVHIISEKCRYRYHDIFTKNYDTNKKHECLKKITPEIVFNKVQEIINSKS